MSTIPRVSQLRTVCSVTLVGLLLLFAGCGSDDATSEAPRPAPAAESSGAAVTDADLGTTPKTCAELRVERYDYDELYREMRCQRQRRKLCRGLATTNIHYADYRCALIGTKTSAAKQRQIVKRRAAAKRRAARARAERQKAEAKQKVAEAKKVERNGFGGRSTSSRGTSSGASGGSSTGGSTSSTYGGGSSSSSSSSSRGSRRR